MRTSTPVAVLGRRRQVRAGRRRGRAARRRLAPRQVELEAARLAARVRLPLLGEEAGQVVVGQGREGGARVRRRLDPATASPRRAAESVCRVGRSRGPRPGASRAVPCRFALGLSVLSGRPSDGFAGHAGACRPTEDPPNVAFRRAVAQLVEHWSPKPAVGGSSPSCPAIAGCGRRARRQRLLPDGDTTRPGTDSRSTPRQRNRDARRAPGAGPTAADKARGGNPVSRLFRAISLFVSQILDELRKVVRPTRLRARATTRSS